MGRAAMMAVMKVKQVSWWWSGNGQDIAVLATDPRYSGALPAEKCQELAI